MKREKEGGCNCGFDNFPRDRQRDDSLDIEVEVLFRENVDS